MTRFQSSFPFRRSVIAMAVFAAMASAYAQSGDDKSKIEKAVADVKEALKGSDAAAIKSASEKLNEAWQAVSAELYKKAAEQAKASGTQTGSSAGGEEAKSDDKKKDEGPIIDAEVVDEKK